VVLDDWIFTTTSSPALHTNRTILHDTYLTLIPTCIYQRSTATLEPGFCRRTSHILIYDFDDSDLTDHGRRHTRLTRRRQWLIHTLSCRHHPRNLLPPRRAPNHPAHALASFQPQHRRHFTHPLAADPQPTRLPQRRHLVPRQHPILVRG
jgi:hypothetical protein